MAKTNITQYDSTPSNNADINSINIAENCPASNINNAIRELMAHLKNMDTGSQALTALSVAGNVTASTSLKTPLIEFTDGDDALTIADGGNVTANADFTVSGAFTSQGIDDNADATAITIDSSENVGIGETSPNGKLNLATGAGTACELRLTSNNTGSGAGDRGRIVVHSARNDGTAFEAGKIEIDRSSGTATEAHMVFATNTGSGNTEHMRINKDGAVLINNTARNDLGNLEVLTTIGVDNAMIIKTPESGASGSATAIKFRYNGGTSGTITFGSTNTAYSTTSDYRLKENVDYTFNATTRLKQLKPCRFNFKSDADTTVDGFLAHEVSSIVPEAISGDKDATDDNGNIVPQGIDQSKLVPLLVKTIQELEARITILENA